MATPRISLADLPRETLDTMEHFVRSDGFKNIATGLGMEQRDHRIASTFAPGRQIQQPEYEAMYFEDPIFSRAVDALPEHACRNWISIQASFDDDATDNAGAGSKVTKKDKTDLGLATLEYMKRLGAKAQTRELLRFGRLDGGALMALGVDDGLDPSEPLDLKRIRTIKHLNVVRRWEVTPQELDGDVTSPTWRQPLFYTFASSSSMLTSNPTTTTLTGRIHASRVIRVRAKHLGDTMIGTSGIFGDQSFSNLHWGVPLAQTIWDDIRQFNSIYAYVEATFKDIVQDMYGIEGMSDLMGSEEGQSKILRRASLMNFMSSIFGMRVYDPSFEKLEKRSLSVTGVDAVMLRYMEKLAAAVEMPMTKLFGMSPGGLSTDDGSGERTWCATTASYQQDIVAPVLDRLVECIFCAQDGPTRGRLPDTWCVDFNPLDEPDEKQEAETRKAEAETDSIHLANGTLSESEVRTRLRNDPTSPYVLDDSYDDAAREMKSLATEPDPELADVATTPGETMGASKPTATGEDVQAQMANGAQVQAAVEMMDSVSSGAIKKSTARQMLISFYRLRPDEADAMLADVVEGATRPLPVPPAVVPPSTTPEQPAP